MEAQAVRHLKGKVLVLTKFSFVPGLTQSNGPAGGAAAPLLSNSGMLAAEHAAQLAQKILRIDAELAQEA